jgi:uncharacterized repeat protein (TIGR01451 family)
MILFCTFLAFIPSAAFGAVSVAFSSQSTALFADQVGSWTVTVTNPDATAVTGATLTVTLPTGYTVSSAGGGTEVVGPPHTLSWTGLSISASGGTVSKTFTAKPACGTSSGAQINALVGTVSTNSTAITLLGLTVSVQAESTSLSVGEEGTWTFKVANGSSTVDATARNIVASVPAGFRITNSGGGTVVAGSPSTITWTGQTIAKSSSATYTFKAIPNSGTISGQTMSLYAHCSSTATSSSSVTIKTPSPSVKVSSGGSAQPTVHKGDTLAWDIVVANGGPGDLLSGLALTETLGTGYTFVSLKDSGGVDVSYTGTWAGGASWNTGAIAANGNKTYTLTVTVTGCANWTNAVSGTWTDGQNTAGTVSSSANAQFVKNLPIMAITQSFPSPLSYCGYPENGNTATIKVENTGSGPAESFALILSGLPSDWGIKNIQVTTGGAGTVTWDSANKKFVIGEVTKAGGTRPAVEFTFTIGPTGAACPPTGSATLILYPDYDDECGVDGLPPVIGPLFLNVSSVGLPSVSLTLTGPRSAHANDSGLTYALSSTYSAAASYGSLNFDLVFHYPSDYTVEDSDSGVLDAVNRTITWSTINLATGGSTAKTVKMKAPSACGAGSDTAFSANITAQTTLATCLGCTFLLSAGATQSTFIDDYKGPVGTSSKELTYYNSMKTALDPALSRGEVNTQNKYEVHYNFTTGSPAPSTWSNTDGLGHNITLYDQAGYGQTLVSIDDVKVGGTSYTTDFSYVNFPGVPLDLGYLDSTAAPKPDTGTDLVVFYTMKSGSSEGSGVDYTRLTIPGIPPACGAKNYFETGHLVDFSRSLVSVATTSPTVMDVAEIKQFTLTLKGTNPWPLYDPILTLDTLGNYSLVGGVGDATYPIVFNDVYTIDGSAVGAFAPTLSGNQYTWTFGSDLRSGKDDDGGGSSPSITFYMRKGCDQAAKNWGAAVQYNDRYTDGSVSRARSASGTGSPVLVRKAALDFQVQPTSISAYDRFPTFRITVWNKGSGVAFNTDVAVDNGTSLKYKAYSVPSDASPDSVTGLSGDNDVSFRYDQIAPGSKRYIDVRDMTEGNSSLGISVTSGWGNGTSYCEQITKAATVLLPPTQVIISAHSVDHKTDYAGHNSRFTVKAKNAGTVRAYHAIVTEILPKGFVYVGNPSYTISSGALTGSPTVAVSGTAATGVTVIWDFSSVLPLDSYGDPSLSTGVELGIQFDAVIDGCAGAQAYTSGDKKANAYVAVDPPYNVTTGGSINVSPTSILATQVATPTVTITTESRNVTDSGTFSTGIVLADYGETVEWRITLKSVGDFLATNVQLSTTLPANTAWVSGSTTLDGVANAWQPGVSGSPISLGEMSINTLDDSQTYVIIYRGTVNAAANDSIHQAGITWGVSGSCSGTIPAMQQTSNATNLTLRTKPVIAITTSIRSYGLTGVTGFTTDGGKLRIVVANTGTRALVNAGDYLSILPPVGYNYNDSASYAPSVSVSGTTGHTITATPSSVANATGTGEAGRGTLKWDNTKIDYVDQGETITLDFCMEADGLYLDTTCAGFGQASDPPIIPTSTVQATLTYHYLDVAPPAQQTKSSSAVTVNPTQADLDISIDPSSPVIEPGDTKKTFTVRIKNNGDATASNVAKVAGTINQPFEFTFGPGFQTPTYVNNAGGTVTVSGSTVTITNMSTFTAAQERTVVFTLSIIDSRPNTDYWVSARIRGTALKDTNIPVSAYSAPGCEGSYSDDSVTVVASEGRLILRPDNSGIGRPGGEMIYIHSLRNNASYGDDILLTATNSLGWSSLFYLVNSSGQISGGPITKITLGAAGSANDASDFALRLFIPGSAAEGAVNATTVKATYNSDAQVYRTVTDTTSVTTARLSMKKQTRNVTTSGAFAATSQGKPGETIEYKIAFQNLGTKEVTNVILSDPVPPFSDLVTNAYSSGGTDYSLHLLLYFADTTVECFTNSSGAHSPAFIELNALCSTPPLSTRFADGIFKLQAGERGELYYRVTIRN